MGDIYFCERCNKSFLSETTRPYCSSCRELNWIEEHADEIEEYMKEGLTYGQAKIEVKRDSKPLCMGCYNPIPKSGYFCTANPECRTLRNRFWRLRQKGYTKDDALREVLHRAPTNQS